MLGIGSPFLIDGSRIGMVVSLGEGGRAWVRLDVDGRTYAFDVCRNCGLIENEHPEKKCLFNHTEWKGRD